MFELQAPWWHFKGAEELAADFPLVTIVVNHTGLSVDRICGIQEIVALFPAQDQLSLFYRSAEKTYRL